MQDLNGWAISIVSDGKGGPWMHFRSEPPIIHFNAEGTIVKSLGEGMFVQAHGFYQDREGDFWAGNSGPFAMNQRRRVEGIRCSIAALTAKSC
jgi:hypothetical protein